jgi:hypothetical protein
MEERTINALDAVKCIIRSKVDELINSIEQE